MPIHLIHIHCDGPGQHTSLVWHHLTFDFKQSFCTIGSHRRQRSPLATTSPGSSTSEEITALMQTTAWITSNGISLRASRLCMKLWVAVPILSWTCLKPERVCFRLFTAAAVDLALLPAILLNFKIIIMEQSVTFYVFVAACCFFWAAASSEHRAGNLCVFSVKQFRKSLFLCQ